MPRTRPLLIALLAVSGLVAAPSIAGAACVTTPATTGVVDSAVDVPAPLTLEATGFTVAISEACVATLDVTVQEERPLVGDEYAAYLIDSDGNLGSGQYPGDPYPGVDYQVRRTADTVAILRWSTTYEEFQAFENAPGIVTAVGNRGATLDLYALAGTGEFVVRMQGGVHTTYLDVDETKVASDLVPDTGLFDVKVSFATAQPQQKKLPVPTAVVPALPISTPLTCRVPTLAKGTLARAKKLLAKANCTSVRVLKRSSKKIKKGRVIRTKAAAGATIPRTTTVFVVISSGKPKAKHKH